VLEAGSEANAKPRPGIPPYTGSHHSRADRLASDDTLLGRGGTTGLPTETTNTSPRDRPLWGPARTEGRETRRPGMGRIPGPVRTVADYVSCAARNPVTSGKVNQASARERTHEKYAVGEEGMQGGEGRGRKRVKP